MNNEVLEKVLQFFKQLKGENRARKSSVQIAGLKEHEMEAEKLWEEYCSCIEKLPVKEKLEIERWVEKKEECCSLQEQNAYCQGYVDCILLLSGLGLLEPEISIENFIEQVNQ